MNSIREKWPDIPVNAEGNAVAVTEVCAVSKGILRIRWDDGIERDVDIASELSGHALLDALNEPAAFTDVHIGEFGGVEWGNGIDMCPHALRLKADEQHAARSDAAE